MSTVATTLEPLQPQNVSKHTSFGKWEQLQSPR